MVICTAASEAPCVKGVEADIQPLSVQCLQYHGRAFVGKSLKVNATLNISSSLSGSTYTHINTSLIDTAQKHSPQLVKEATALCIKYNRAFSLFLQYHNLYNKNCITEQEKKCTVTEVHNMHYQY